MSEKPEIPLYCYFKGSYNPKYEDEILRCKEKCFEYNNLRPSEQKRKAEVLKSILNNAADDTIVVAPFWCDYGYHITVGKSFYANHNLVVQDGGSVTFGDYVFIGPNCCFTTAEHAMDPEMRRDGIEVAKPITVGNNVWFGANVTVLAGVEIGDNAVIGAGSVVTKSIPANAVAVGVPCKPIREITSSDRTTYPYHESLKR